MSVPHLDLEEALALASSWARDHPNAYIDLLADEPIVLVDGPLTVLKYIAKIVYRDEVRSEDEDSDL